ncbi:MAG: hypothetical protein ACP5JU_00320 [Minisyncoccia bacterium]
MRRVKNRSLKGKKLEKEFSRIIQDLFKSAATELKPRIINLPKDFWGLFDGLTFIKSKKKFIFWQIKSKRLTKKEREDFWKKAKIFGNKKILILLIEKANNEWKIFTNEKRYYNNLNSLKNII